MSYNNLRELIDTFADTKTHEEVAKIIYAHSSNKSDVREAALENQSFEKVKKILDLGCGFGFFTRSLRNKVNSKTSILGVDRCHNYQNAYLNSCEIAKLKGSFIGSGVFNLYRQADDSYDFIICSYAMYFFPDIVDEVSRILKPDGSFVIITHSINHLSELISFIKNIFIEQGFNYPDLLPYEKLIRNFSDENGMTLLSKSFKKVEEKDYKSTLIFEKGDTSNLKKYLLFKQPFYLPKNLKVHLRVYDEIISGLCSKLEQKETLRFTKDDTIYICKNPY